MNAPYITVPFQGQAGFGTVTPSFGFVQQSSNAWATPNTAWATPNTAWATPNTAWATPNATWGIGVSNIVAQPQNINAVSIGQSVATPFASLPYGAIQQQGTPSQVLAIVPYQSGTQSPPTFRI